MGVKLAWNNNYFDNSKEEAEGLVYDLRQTYAQILDEVLKRIAECRVKNDYTAWFDALEHLSIEINQKLLEPERKEYNKELVKCIKILRENTGVFNGQSKSQEGTFKIKCALRDLEKWLKIKMEEHKLFGAIDVEDDGL
ncbi:MAG: hypothetical protein B6229_00385 [Spirochaetaceae bacterium 4572_7]|nr:MAG: hypothetical protein B6229_00385 [Spirochaetaceae bacterium 4572_7]